MSDNECTGYIARNRIQSDDARITCDVCKKGLADSNLGAPFITHWFYYSGDRLAEIKKSINLAESVIFNRSAVHRYSGRC